MTSPSTRDTPSPPRKYHPMAGLLSYLVPGLGQIIQGRVAKGMLFLVCVYGLFFYGIYIGSGSVKIGERTYTVSSNVYLPTSDPDAPAGRRDPGYTGQGWLRFLGLFGTNLYDRPQFAGQFWVGVVAWPAILQYNRFDREKADRIDRLYNDAESVSKSDPEEAAAKRETAEKLEKELAHPLFGSYMREPYQTSINAVHNARDKRLELAWVFTVIAGVLNILVIYDAVAGPAFLLAAPKNEKKAA